MNDSSGAFYAYRFDIVRLNTIVTVRAGGSMTGVVVINSVFMLYCWLMARMLTRQREMNEEITCFFVNMEMHARSMSVKDNK